MDSPFLQREESQIAQAPLDAKPIFCCFSSVSGLCKGLAAILLAVGLATAIGFQASTGPMELQSFSSVWYLGRPVVPLYLFVGSRFFLIKKQKVPVFSYGCWTTKVSFQAAARCSELVLLAQRGYHAAPNVSESCSKGKFLGYHAGVRVHRDWTIWVCFARANWPMFGQHECDMVCHGTL